MGVRKLETSLIVWTGSETIAQAQAAPALADPAESPFTGDQFYDAGAKGCGEGPLDTIAGIVRKMQSGQTLVIHATDPSVAVDLAAWARMTGNTLLDQSGSYYLVSRK